MTHSDRFQEFVRACNSRRAALGLSGWDVTYECRPMKDAEAETDANPDGQECAITMDRDLPAAKVQGAAVHELMHVVLSPLAELAKNRFVRSEELEREEERVVCLLASYIRWLEIGHEKRGNK